MSSTNRNSTMRATGAARAQGQTNPQMEPPANAIVISSSELDSIRRQAFMEGLKPVNRADESESQLKEARKTASKARAEKWPNTLAGARAAKDQARRNERAAKEAALVELDEMEENLRLQERLTVIRKANDYYSKQSDRMKALENYRQRSYDMDVERAQAALKAERAGGEAARESNWAASVLADVEAAAAEEVARGEAARAKAAKIAADQKTQLASVIARRMEEFRAREAEGRAMLESTNRMLAEANSAAVAKQASAQAKALEFKEENKRLAEARASLKDAEREMVAWIDAQARAKDAQEGKIKAIIEAQRAEAARKAKLITEIMAKDYQQRANAEEGRVARDAAAAEAKQEAAASEKRASQAAMRASILAHIQAMKDKTIAAIIAQKEEDARDHAIFQAKLAALEAQERADKEAQRVRARQFQLVHKAQAADKKLAVEGTAEMDRADVRHGDALAAGGPMDEAFHAEVAKLRQEEIEKGHDTKPLDRLVHKLLNPPMLANIRM